MRMISFPLHVPRPGFHLAAIGLQVMTSPITPERQLPAEIAIMAMSVQRYFRSAVIPVEVSWALRYHLLHEAQA